MGSLAVIAFGCFVVAFFLRRANKAPNIRAILFGAAGLGVGGLLADIVYKVLRVILHSSDIGTAKLFGGAIPGAILFIVVVYLLFEVGDPKNKTPHRWADYAMFVLPFLLVLAGGSYAEFVVHAQHGEVEAGSGFINFIHDVIREW